MAVMHPDAVTEEPEPSPPWEAPRGERRRGSTPPIHSRARGAHPRRLDAAADRSCDPTDGGSERRPSADRSSADPRTRRGFPDRRRAPGSTTSRRGRRPRSADRRCAGRTPRAAAIGLIEVAIHRSRPSWSPGSMLWASFIAVPREGTRSPRIRREIEE
jgi:hypothetical protein